MPRGFDLYARVFNPGWRSVGGRRAAVRWAEMAAHTGCRAHPLMQWDKIASPTMRGMNVDRPDEGTLPPVVSSPLQEILSRHTESDACYLGVWRGFGWTYRAQVPDTKSVDEGGGREWDLFRASLKMIGFRFFERCDQTANLIWAEDRSWWLTMDIDLNSSYIGGSGPLIEALLASRELEVWPAVLADNITNTSDEVNSRLR